MHVCTYCTVPTIRGRRRRLKAVPVHAVLRVHLQTVLGELTAGANPFAIAGEQRRGDAEDGREARQQRDSDVGTQGAEHARREERKCRRQDRPQERQRREPAGRIAQVAVGQVAGQHGLEFVPRVPDEDERNGRHPPVHAGHARRNRPGEAPQRGGQDGRADREARQFVFRQQGPALALTLGDDVTVEHAGEDAGHETDADGDEGQTGVLGLEAERLVDGRQRLGEEIGQRGEEGAHDRHGEDDGLAEEQADGPEERNAGEGAHVGRVIRVQAAQAVDAGGFAQLGDLATKQQRRTRFSDEEEQTGRDGGDDCGDVKHPLPERMLKECASTGGIENESYRFRSAAM